MTSTKRISQAGGNGSGEALDKRPSSGPPESAPGARSFSGPLCASCPAYLAPGDGHLACFRCLGADHAAAAMAAPVSSVACRELPEEGILSRHLFFSPAVDLADAIDWTTTTASSTPTTTPPWTTSSVTRRPVFPAPGYNRHRRPTWETAPDGRSLLEIMGEAAAIKGFPMPAPPLVPVSDDMQGECFRTPSSSRRATQCPLFPPVQHLFTAADGALTKSRCPPTASRDRLSAVRSTIVVGQHVEMGPSHTVQASSPTLYGVGGDHATGPGCKHGSGSRGGPPERWDRPGPRFLPACWWEEPGVRIAQNRERFSRTECYSSGPIKGGGLRVAVGRRVHMASGSPASKKRRPLEPRGRIRDSLHELVDTAACTRLLVPHIIPSTSIQQFVGGEETGPRAVATACGQRMRTAVGSPSLRPLCVLARAVRFAIVVGHHVEIPYSSSVVPHPLWGWWRPRYGTRLRARL
ncbi:unnamed protein product [Boreogadus saida]